MSITTHIQASGLTRSQICSAVGLSRSMLSMIERGERKASPEKAMKLAEVLKISPSAIRPDLAVFGSNDQETGAA